MEIGEEESAHYRDVANDNELIDCKFCESYEHLLASIKCTMAKCDEPGCVLKVFTKGHDYKDTTTSKSRGSVKGTKCGKSASFGTCLQQWFGLGIIEDIMRQAKESETVPMTSASKMLPDEQRNIEMKGRNDRAIALIAENITQTADKVKAIRQQAETEKAALAARMDKADRATEVLMQNLKVMQQNLDAAMDCRENDKEFNEKNIVRPSEVEAPPAHTLAFNWAPAEVAAAPPTSNWPALNLTKIDIKQPRDTITKVAETEKDNFCKTYAEALKLKKHEKAARVERKMPSPRHRAQQDDADDLVEICVKDMEHEKASILRRNIRNILNDDQHCLHVRYMQADRVELLVPRH